MATKVAKIIFGLLGLVLVVAALVPALGGEPVNTKTLSAAAVPLLLALLLRPRRPPASPPRTERLTGG